MAKNQGNLEAGISPEALEAAIAGSARATPSVSDQEFEALKLQVAMLIKQAADKDKIIADLSAVAADTCVASVSHATTKARYAIIVDEGRDQHDEPGVFVSVNGRAYQLKRGVTCEVPPEILEALDHAVIDKHIPVTDANGMPNGTITRASRRFPYQNRGKVVDENGERIATFQ